MSDLISREKVLDIIGSGSQCLYCTIHDDCIEHGGSIQCNDIWSERAIRAAVKALPSYDVQAREQWHDLRKNPNDLPPDNDRRYIVVFARHEDFNETATGKCIRESFKWDDVAKVIAWREFPRWDGAAE